MKTLNEFSVLLRSASPASLCRYAGILSLKTLCRAFPRTRISVSLRRKRFVLSIAGAKWAIPLMGEDIGIIDECFIKRRYEEMEGFSPAEGDVCLDIGANIGACSLGWRQSNRTGRIFSVEPHPETYHRMVANLEANGASNIVPVRAALGSRSETATFYARPGYSMVTSCRTEGAKPVEITTVTLDELARERGLDGIDLCKIDVEGYEIECLRGAKETLPRIRRMVLEFHDEGFRESVIEILKKDFQILFVEKDSPIGLIFAQRKTGDK